MITQDYIQKLGINKEGTFGDDGYVINLLDSKEYGKIFSILEKSDQVNILEDNQVITDQGSSLTYEDENEPILLNLLADFENNIYQLVITEIND